ncbi:MAG: hypothetical protein FWG98_14600, partial [Candidatus Cloacimonetes bacterium]|nr:hypothetical protein [Candidatus Cloacimonadota bacterium]
SLIGNGIIYGSVESGVPADLANSSGVSGAALYRSSTDAVVKYTNGLNVLPHCDGFDLYTDFTISLDLMNIKNNVNNPSNPHFDNPHKYSEYKE